MKKWQVMEVWTNLWDRNTIFKEPQLDLHHCRSWGSLVCSEGQEPLLKYEEQAFCKARRVTHLSTEAGRSDWIPKSQCQQHRYSKKGEDNIHRLFFSSWQLTTCRSELSITTTCLIQKKPGLHFTVHTNRDPEVKSDILLPPSTSRLFFHLWFYI